MKKEKVKYIRKINEKDINYWTELIHEALPETGKNYIQILVNKCSAFLLEKIAIILFETI